MSTTASAQGAIDQAGSVRQGEELNLETLNPWLTKHISGLTGQPKVTQYAGGASNWTYCLAYSNPSGIDTEVILRRGPAGTKAKGAHDMGREYRLQAALKPVYHYVPEMLAHCEDESVIGAEFYVMQKFNGIIPRKNLPRNFSLNVADTRQLCENALDSLIELHKVDYQAAQLSHIAKGSGYTKRQIDGWIGRYQKARTWNAVK